MTTVIDERVVEMKFNNAEFEKNVAQSMKTLDDLKKSLNFEGAGKSLEELAKASNNFRLSGIADTVQEVSNKFSAMEIVGMTAIAKITSSAMDMGVQLVKSLSVDQVTTGFNKYAEKTTAIQTIMAATESMFSSQAEQMKVVESEMSKLAWFTDETSYNFIDMVSNIGKFTSNKIGLEESVTAMQGIANWAARSGQNAQAASRAMYNISQAMGAGAMKQKDWMSIENANMATAEFKQTAIETAEELGRLKKVSDGLWTTLDGKGTVTVETFREELKRGWFDKDVMSETFRKYGQYTNVLYELAEMTDLSASEIMQASEKFKKGELDITSFAAETGASVDELTDAFNRLNEEGNDLGRKAFGNAQEAKTFMEAIEATKDAVSTKWTETFELIFGNYLEAKKLWTGLANDLWQAFAAGGDERNTILEYWRAGDIDGRTALIEGLINAVNLLVKPLSTVKQALRDMFPDAEGMGKALNTLTIRFRDFMASLQPSNEMLANIYRTFKGLFTIGKLVSQVIFSIVKAILPAARPFGSLLELILQFTGYAGVFIEVIAEYAEEVGLFQTITEGVVFVFSKLLQAIKTVATIIGGGLFFVASTVVSVFGKIISAVTGFISKTQIIQKAIAGITKVVDKFRSMFSRAEKPIEKVNTVIVESEKYFSAAATSGAEFGTVINDTGEKSKKALTPLQRVANVIKLVVTALGVAVVTVIKLIGKLWENIKEFFSNLSKRFNDANEDKNAFIIVFEELFNRIKEILGDAKDKIKEFFDNLGIDTSGIKKAFDTINTALGIFIKNVGAGRIVAIVLSVALLALVGEAIDLAQKISTLSGTMNSFIKNINKILSKQFGGKVTVITDLAKAFALMAGSLALLMAVDKDGTKIVRFAATMGVLVGALSIVAAIIDIVTKKILASNSLATSLGGAAKTLIALAGAMIIMAGAIAILNQVKVKNEDLLNLQLKMLMAFGGLVAISAIAVALSYLIGPISRGAATIIALSIAIMQVARAMKEMSTIPIDDINARWPEYTAMFGGLAAMLASSSLVSIRSALGLILTAKGIEMLLPQLGAIVEAANKLPAGAIIKAAEEHIGLVMVAVLGITMAVIGLALLVERQKSVIDKVKGGSVFNGIGGTLAGLGLGIFLIVSAIQKIQEVMHNLTMEGELKEIGITIGIIMGAMALFTGLILAADRFTKVKFPTDAATSFIRMGAMFVALGVAMRLMASAVTTIAESSANGWELAGATAILIAFGGMLAWVLYAAGNVPKAIPAMAALLAACVAMGVLIGEFAVLTLLVQNTDIDTFLDSIIVMGGIFTGMIFLMKAMSSLQNVKPGVIWGIAATIGAIGAVLVALTLVSAYNPVGLVISIAGLAGVLGVLSLIFTVLGEMDTPSIKKIVSMVVIITTIGAIGAALAIVAKNDWPSILVGAIGMVAVLGAVAGLLIVLDQIGSQGGQLGAAGAILMVSISLVAIAEALNTLKGIDTGEAAGKVAALLGIVSGIVLIFGLLSAVPALGQAFAIGMVAFSASLLTVSLAFTVFAAAVTPLAEGLNLLTPALAAFATQVPFVELAAGLIEMSRGLEALGWAGVVLGIGSLGLIGGAAGIWALGAAVGSAVGSFEQLAAVDLASIAWGLGEIGVAGAVIGFMAPAMLVGAAAFALFGGALYILKGGLEAILGMFTVFGMEVQNGTASIKTSLDGSKKDFGDFMTAVAGTFGGPLAAAVVKAATSFGKLIGGKKGSGEGVVGGFSEETQYASPPGFILDFMDACATAFGMNGGAVAAASQSGAEMGNALGESFFDKAMGWISSVGSSISGWWSNMTGHFNITDNPKVINDLGSAGAAAEKFGKQTQKTGNIFTDTINKGKELIGGLGDKVTEKLKEPFEGVEGILKDNYISDSIEEITDKMNEATEGAGGFGDAVESAGGKAKGAAGDVKELGDSLKDTISNQLDMFSKFEIKTGVTAETMLENMRSNINGFASWSHRMSVLAERFATAGIDQGLYKKLAELGPKGYETMNAFYEMSEEQLAEVRDLWATGLTLPDSQADIVNSGFQYMGEMAAQGFSNALDDHKAAHEAAHGLGKAALDGLSEALEVHSPSRATEQIGQYLIEGLARGLDSVYGQGILYFAVKHVSEHILTLFNENLSPEVMGEAGSGILTNLFNGLLGESIEANPIMTAFIETFTNFEPIDEALTLFVEHIKELFYEQFEIEGDGEPSVWFYRYAFSWLQAIINSFIENEVLVRAQIIIFCMQIIETFDEQDLPGFAYDTGMNIALGLKEGIEDYAEEAITAAQDMVEAVMEIMAEVPQVESPSKVTRSIGGYISQGLALGIEDGASNVYNAAKTVAEGGIDGMQGEMGRLQDLMTNGLDFNPIITPMLDLSYIKQQMSELDYLMNDPEYGIGQNGGDMATGKTQQISFTQNNYSPKSLSRYEIYRQTKNQLSQLKGALG